MGWSRSFGIVGFVCAGATEWAGGGQGGGRRQGKLGQSKGSAAVMRLVRHVKPSRTECKAGSRRKEETLAGSRAQR